MSRLIVQQHRIIEHVRKRGACVRAGIARELGMNSAVASELVRQLLQIEVLARSGAEASTGGRPRERVRLNESVVSAIGVQVAMRGIRGGLVNVAGELVSEHVPQAPHDGKVSEIVDAIVETINALRRDAGPRRMGGVGIGISGVIHSEAAVTREFPFGERWLAVPLADIVEQRCGVRPLLINDVHASALAELHLGAWEDMKSLVLLHLGDGIAAGFVVRGELYRGHTGNAGQVGHNVVSEDGSLCYCGNRGCLESVASPRAMVEACREAAARGVQTRVLDEAGGRPIALSHITSAAAQGDAFAVSLLREAGRKIGEVAASLVNTFEPQLLLLSGTLAEESEELVEAIQRSAGLRILPALREITLITCARLKGSSAVLGAGLAVLDEFFADPVRVERELLAAGVRLGGDST